MLDVLINIANISNTLMPPACIDNTIKTQTRNHSWWYNHISLCPEANGDITVNKIYEKLNVTLREFNDLKVSEQFDFQKLYLYSIITHSTAIE